MVVSRHPDGGRPERAQEGAGSSGAVGCDRRFRTACRGQGPVAGTGPPATLSARSGLLRHRARVGNLPAVARALEQLLADKTRVLGPDHPETLITRGSLATVRGGYGDVARAVDDTEQLLQDRTRLLGSDHPDTRASREHLAYWRARQ
ncbi:tetratricopeptide repeat protein [Actinokineospora sp. 24-640]